MRERSSRPDRKYAAVPNAMLRDNTLSMDARGLLALLMTYADDWRFNRDHMLTLTGWGKDKFGAVMGHLIERGYVENVFDRDETGRLLGRTWVIRDDPRQDAVIRKKPTTDRDPENTVVGQNRNPENTVVGEIRPIRRSTEDKNTNRQETPTPSGQGALFPEKDAEKPKDEPDVFDAFWALYPKCERKTDKPKAREAFWKIIHGKHKLIPKTEPHVILDGLRAYARTGPDPQYIPLPTTWLNGARWENVPAGVGQNVNDFWRGQIER
jgi:hypothetical protein